MPCGAFCNGGINQCAVVAVWACYSIQATAVHMQSTAITTDRRHATLPFCRTCHRDAVAPGSLFQVRPSCQIRTNEFGLGNVNDIWLAGYPRDVQAYSMILTSELHGIWTCRSVHAYAAVGQTCAYIEQCAMQAVDAATMELSTCSIKQSAASQV